MLSQLALPVSVPTTASTVVLRRAEPTDLDALVLLLSDDAISASRGDAADPADVRTYERALARIIEDPGNDIVVAEDASGRVVGTLQLTSIPGMARRGSTRLLVEAVRVRSDVRSSGVGGAMMRWVTESAAPAVGARLVQLTSDSRRTDAHRFYTRLGFTDSHIGFKYTV